MVHAANRKMRLYEIVQILILIITGNADSPGRVWCGGGKDTGVKWARFMKMPGNCDDY